MREQEGVTVRHAGADECLSAPELQRAAGALNAGIHGGACHGGAQRCDLTALLPAVRRLRYLDWIRRSAVKELRLV
jgi:hypothetical protein